MNNAQRADGRCESDIIVYMEHSRVAVPKGVLYACRRSRVETVNFLGQMTHEAVRANAQRIRVAPRK